MGKLKDKFWQHAEQLDNGYFKCKFCEKQFYEGVTRLKYHLARVSGHDVAPYEKVTDDVQAQGILLVNSETSNKRRKGESGTCSSSFSMTSRGQRQSTMEEAIPSIDKPTWENSLREFFIKNNIPFNVVQSESFINLLKCTARYGPSVPIPSYSTLRGRIIPEARKGLEKYAGEVKLSWKETDCTIMSDSWTDLKRRSFINVTACSSGDALFLKSEECSHARVTGPSIFDILEGRYHWLFKTRCAAHEINLMLKDIYETVIWVQEIFDEAKGLIDYMYRSVIVLQLMRQLTHKDLKYPCKIRFASNFLMLQSIIEVEEKLKLLVASAE
ncbi:uncharacterized protein LOC122643581 [Telopea speciosissima]|uniref:uncharacterized protein LOC122643581 n=1 Tax=Telopea speciosissima TaxID=54955 RepID=UPI001CC6DB51|nr:uncharacterized protein LOC122643581 [Telopea speciosissima]